MRLRNIPGAREIVAQDQRCFDTGDETAGKWSGIFGRKAQLMAEIGMGKGRFIIDMALKHPDIDFIGVERYESVMIKALQKLDRMKKEGGMVPDNIRFIRMDAADIGDFFKPEELDRIYLNFSDPWPKDRHAKRRLPSRQFLERYDKILKEDGCIEFKTDNRDLFDFAVEELEDSKWHADYISYDLHSDEKLMVGNVMTEYEEKFSSLGNPIYKYCIRRDNV
jgi:tRNA (guanine-N7-)-methyltransferase